MKQYEFFSINPDGQVNIYHNMHTNDYWRAMQVWECTLKSDENKGSRLDGVVFRLVFKPFSNRPSQVIKEHIFQ